MAWLLGLSPYSRPWALSPVNPVPNSWSTRTTERSKKPSLRSANCVQSQANQIGWPAESWSRAAFLNTSRGTLTNSMSPASATFAVKRMR